MIIVTEKNIYQSIAVIKRGGWKFEFFTSEAKESSQNAEAKVSKSHHQDLQVSQAEDKGKQSLLQFKVSFLLNQFVLIFFFFLLILFLSLFLWKMFEQDERVTLTFLRF